MNINSRIITISVLFLLKFLFGFWLYRTGKPYNVIVLAVHKLVSLAIVVVIVLTINNLRGDIGLNAAEISATVATGVLFLLTIASGGVLSVDKPIPAIVSIVHKVTPFLSILSTGVLVYLLV